MKAITIFLAMAFVFSNLAVASAATSQKTEVKSASNASMAPGDPVLVVKTASAVLNDKLPPSAQVGAIVTLAAVTPTYDPLRDGFNINIFNNDVNIPGYPGLTFKREPTGPNAGHYAGYITISQSPSNGNFGSLQYDPIGGKIVEVIYTGSTHTPATVTYTYQSDPYRFSKAIVKMTNACSAGINATFQPGVNPEVRTDLLALRKLFWQVLQYIVLNPQKS